MSSGITVVIPSIPPRGLLLQRAISSVLGQTLPAAGIVVAFDHDREGAGPTRTRGLRQVRSKWVAFLDDDDELYSCHLAMLHEHAEQTGADVIWPWFDVAGGWDPFPQSRGRPYDPDHPHTFPVTALVRTELAQHCWFPAPVGPFQSGDDDAFWAMLAKLEARFSPISEVTWLWHHDSGNTSGVPTRW